MDIDPIKRAINDFEILKKMIPEDELRSKFRARARAFPGLIESVGLISALSFCYAKSTHDIYKEVLNSFSEFKQLKGGFEEKKSHGLYLYLTLNYLNHIGLIDQKDLEKPVEALKKLCEKSNIAVRLLIPYLAQIKRLSEAVFKED
jgi:CRISPR type III-B/RAMP module-associated protein Cmr5